MLAKDIMTAPVVTIEPTATILQAIRLMLQKRISGLPVVDAQGRLVGMVSEGDFLRRGEIGTVRRRPRWLEFLIGPGQMAEEYAHAFGRSVEDVMTREVEGVDDTTPLPELVERMEKHQVKRLPVMRGQEVVGIVSRANLMHALATIAAHAETPASQSDVAIRESLAAEFKRLSWAPSALVNTIVRDGVVELWGAITDDRERRGIVVAVQNIPGVKAVRDHLVLIDIHTGLLLEPVDPRS